MAKAPYPSPKNYEVGYGRPPKQTQFKSGQSGNPKGRPKGQPTASDLFLREAARLVRIQVGDKVESISKLEAVIRKLFNMAISGDPRAMGMLLAADARFGLGTSEATQLGAGESVLGTIVPDEEALRRMLARFDHLRSD